MENEIIIKIKIRADTEMSLRPNNGEKVSERFAFSQYARCFDECCPGWCNSLDNEFNRNYLLTQQEYANMLLKNRGYLFLNDVYDMLGMPRTKIGQVVGWIYDEQNPIGDNYVDFGLGSKSSVGFMNGRENTVILDFNVDGAILDRI